MSDRLNKTSICSIIFLDIIAYSEKPVFEQSEYKDRFNAQINAALNSVAADDRIILDTGDGAAITLLGEPEEALFVALRLRDGILQDNAAHPDDAPLEVRIGINLGPVRLVKDINDRLNVIGDGINVAQRVMNFSEANQILVSRSYFEIVSRLTKEMTGMFSYSGVKQDKHVREHEVYLITPGAGPHTVSGPNTDSGPSTVSGAPAKASAAHQPQLKRVDTGVRSLPILITGVVAMVAVVAIVVLVLRQQQPAAVPVAAAPTTAAPPVEAAPAPVQAQPQMPAPQAAPSAAVPDVAEPSAPIKAAKAPRRAQKPSSSEQDIFVGADKGDFGGGYLTKDENGQQVILYGSEAQAARARDRAR